MSRRDPDPPARRRRGAIPEVEIDGSVTLYGVEDWTELRDDPVFEIVQHIGPVEAMSDEVDGPGDNTAPDADGG